MSTRALQNRQTPPAFPPGSGSSQIKILVLVEEQIEAAIDCFARGIARDWPCSEEQAAAWVRGEFHDPESTIFGAYRADSLVGVCSLVGMPRILNDLREHEREIVREACTRAGITIEASRFLGGLAVEREQEGRGVTRDLVVRAEAFARELGVHTLLSHTARPSAKYPAVQGLGLALKRWGGSELPVSEPIFHESPKDLEAVWLYKRLD